MKTTHVLLMLLCAGVLLLGGCSGAGKSADDIRGASLHTLSADHLTTVVLATSWLQVLYPPDIGHAPPPDMAMMPDGSIRLTGITSDGASYEWFIYPDGSSSGTFTRPDGISFESTADPVVFAGNTSREHVTNTYSNGLRMETTIVSEYLPGNTVSTWNGTAETAANTVMAFTLRRSAVENDELTLNLPDRSTLNMQVPFSGDGSTHPAMQRGAMGTFVSAHNRTLNFSVKGTTRWDFWHMEAADGTQGRFTLGENMQGTGQLQQGNSLAGVLQWTQQGAGTLHLLGAGQEEVSPSAAARDFRINQWINNIAALGPTPMY